ncbi:MAG: sulfatase [Herbinix sp.]|nr:sulfatase [Herbinix sp.]
MYIINLEKGKYDYHLEYIIQEKIMRILFVDIDTLRPDHMSCYGYNRKTTPNMDKVAEEGLSMQNYYCSDAPCLPSRASLVSGIFGIRNGAVGHGGTAADRRLGGVQRGFRDSMDANNLHNIFRKANLYTASISTFAERHSSWWFNAGFHETYNVGGGGAESGEEVLPIALDWLNKNAQKDDWFLHVHLWDPHTPYRTPADFSNPFETEELTTWIDQKILSEHQKKTGPHSASELNMYNDEVTPRFPKQLGRISNLQDLKYHFDQYDGGIYYSDYLIGKILDYLKSIGIYEEVAIIITSDHGENMGELGIYSEHGTADKATCNIPMIIKWPGGVKGRKDASLHYSLDLLPTMAELLGVEGCPDWDGKSYCGTVLYGNEEGRDSLVISQMAHVCQRSARFDQWLYVRTYHDGFHLFDRELLFNLEEDPYEQKDVKEQYPEVSARGAKIILDWLDDQMLKSTSQIDPLWTVMKEGGPYHTLGQLPNYIERLEKTGRKDGAELLRKRYR